MLGFSPLSEAPLSATAGNTSLYAAVSDGTTAQAIVAGSIVAHSLVGQSITFDVGSTAGSSYNLFITVGTLYDSLAVLQNLLGSRAGDEVTFTSETQYDLGAIEEAVDQAVQFAFDAVPANVIASDATQSTTVSDSAIDGASYIQSVWDSVEVQNIADSVNAVFGPMEQGVTGQAVFFDELTPDETVDQGVEFSLTIQGPAVIDRAVSQGISIAVDTTAFVGVFKAAGDTVQITATLGYEPVLVADAMQSYSGVTTSTGGLFMKSDATDMAMYDAGEITARGDWTLISSVTISNWDIIPTRPKTNE